jgi:hypothetical protein
MRRMRIVGGGDDVGGEAMCSSAKTWPCWGTDNKAAVAGDNATGVACLCARAPSIVNADRLWVEQSCGAASAGVAVLVAWHDGTRVSGGAHNGWHQTLPPATTVITVAQIAATSVCRRDRPIRPDTSKTRRATVHVSSPGAYSLQRCQP